MLLMLLMWLCSISTASYVGVSSQKSDAKSETNPVYGLHTRTNKVAVVLFKTFNGFICHHSCHQCTSDIAHQSNGHIMIIIIAVESRAAQVLVGLRALVSQRGSSTMARLRFDLDDGDDLIRILMMMVMRPLTRTALTWSLVPQRAGWLPTIHQLEGGRQVWKHELLHKVPVSVQDKETKVQSHLQLRGGHNVWRK